MDENTKRVMFSSKTGNWATPQEFYDKLNAEVKALTPKASREEAIKGAVSDV